MAFVNKVPGYGHCGPRCRRCLRCWRNKLNHSIKGKGKSGNPQAGKVFIEPSSRATRRIRVTDNRLSMWKDFQASDGEMEEYIRLRTSHYQKEYGESLEIAFCLAKEDYQYYILDEWSGDKSYWKKQLKRLPMPLE